MNAEEVRLLRKAVEASLEFAFANREVGADDHRASARREQRAADEAWDQLVDKAPAP